MAGPWMAAGVMVGPHSVNGEAPPGISIALRVGAPCDLHPHTLVRSTGLSLSCSKKMLSGQRVPWTGSGVCLRGSLV